MWSTTQFRKEMPHPSGSPAHPNQGPDRGFLFDPLYSLAPRGVGRSVGNVHPWSSMCVTSASTTSANLPSTFPRSAPENVLRSTSTPTTTTTYTKAQSRVLSTRVKNVMFPRIPSIERMHFLTLSTYSSWVIERPKSHLNGTLTILASQFPRC